MAGLTFPYKDPNEVLDYVLDWTSRIGTDDIDTSTWTVPDGITKNSDTIDAGLKKTKIWLSGGTAGQKYTLLNRIVTAGGRTMDQSVKISVKEK